MKINTGNIISYESGHARIIEILNDRYLVNEVTLTPYNVIDKDKKFCIMKNSRYTNLGKLD